MRVFLKIHGEVLINHDDGSGDESEEADEIDEDEIKLDDGDDGRTGRTSLNVLRNVLTEWRVEVKKESDRIGELVGYCSGVVGFLRSGR